MSGLDSLGSAYQDDDFEDEQDDAAMPEVSAAQVSPASQGQELDGSTGNADAALLMDGAPGIGASLLESCHVVQPLDGGLQNGNSSSAGHADVPHTADKDAHNADVLDSSIDTIRELGKTRAPLCTMRVSWARCGSVCLRLLFHATEEKYGRASSTAESAGCESASAPRAYFVDARLEDLVRKYDPTGPAAAAVRAQEVSHSTHTHTHTSIFAHPCMFSIHARQLLTATYHRSCLRMNWHHNALFIGNIRSSFPGACCSFIPWSPQEWIRRATFRKSPRTSAERWMPSTSCCVGNTARIWKVLQPSALGVKTRKRTRILTVLTVKETSEMMSLAVEAKAG